MVENKVSTLKSASFLYHAARVDGIAAEAEGGEEGGARRLRLLLRPPPPLRMGMKMVGCVIQLLLRVWCAEHRVPLGLQ